MRRHILTSLAAFVVLSVLLGVLYPLAVYAIGQVAFKNKADGSLIKVNGTVVGSKLIAEDFTSAKYFFPRPSKTAAPGYDGNGYDASASGASNQGPSNPNLIGNVPGVNIDGSKNPYATPTDPTCVPVQATDKDGNDITDKAGNAVYEKNKDGTYVCNPGTVPQRVLAYRKENGLAAEREGSRRRRHRVVLGARSRHQRCERTAPGAAGRARPPHVGRHRARARVEVHRRPRARVHGRARRQRPRSSTSRSTANRLADEVVVEHRARAGSGFPCPAR